MGQFSWVVFVETLRNERFGAKDRKQARRTKVQVAASKFQAPSKVAYQVQGSHLPGERA